MERERLGSSLSSPATGGAEPPLHHLSYTHHAIPLVRGATVGTVGPVRYSLPPYGPNRSPTVGPLHTRGMNGKDEGCLDGITAVGPNLPHRPSSNRMVTEGARDVGCATPPKAPLCGECGATHVPLAPRDPFKEIRDRKMKDFIDFKWVSCVDSYLLS